MRATASCFLALVFTAAALAEEEAPAAAETPAAVLVEQEDPESYVPTSPRWPLLARIGVRAGYVMLLPGKGLEYENGPLAGLQIAFARFGEARVSSEFGADVAYFREIDDLRDSVMLSQRLDIVFSLPVRNERFEAYLLAGAAAVEELVIDFDGILNRANYAVAVNLGGGVTFWQGRLDLRLTESLFIGSGNVIASTMLSVACRF